MSVFDKRLIAVAELLGKKEAVVDVGTDHGFLPVYIIKNNLAERVIACDIAKGPLSVASSNIKKYKLENKISLRLADGLSGVAPNECDGITIAGMGGETIARIIDETPWIFNKKSGYTLVLQPMSCDDRLRQYLTDNCFNIEKEKAVFSKGRVYTVMRASYIGAKINEGPEFKYIGRLLDDPQEEEIVFVKRRLKVMRDCMEEIKNVEQKKALFEEMKESVQKIEALL